jgi:hypothetical protein
MRLTRASYLVLPAIIAFAAPATATDLDLKRVVLSSGGVGYFEYEATVDGDAALTLDVPLDQVDDVLKSLVVYDQGGRAGEITLPGREPLARSFADLPFDQSALASTTALLNALQGSDVRAGGDEPISGQLLHAEDVSERNADGFTETLTRVSILTESGVRQITLKELDPISFTDPALQAQVKTALGRVAMYRAQGQRQLTIAAHGDGQRTVRIGYVVAVPLWKASYRLVLPADATASNARLQGWAVLENFSGQSWSGVELTLLSGNPVTFRQALYQSYYVPRPSVPVESGSHVLPPPDTGALADEATKPAGATENTTPPMLRQFARRAAPAAMAAGMPAPAPAPPPPPEPAQIEAAAASESTTQVAFTLPNKINVGAGQSLVVPVIDRELPAHRVEIYQPLTDSTHPLAAIELTNAAETGLPPGVLTLYQQGDRGAEYLGDARLAAFPAGDKRLLSYAVDNKVTVTSDSISRDAIVKATIAEGVMHLTRLNRVTTTERISSTTPPAHLIIEKSALGGNWRLASPPADQVEKTPGGAYRIAATLDAKGNGTVTIVEEQPVEETTQLADLGDDQIGVVVAAKELDPKLRQALGDLVQRRQTVHRLQAALERLNDERGRLTDDESRLRDNYTALKDDPAMRKTTLDKLKTADAAIDDNAAASAKATSALAAAEADLTAYIGGLKL